METGDIILFGGAAFLGYMILKPKTNTAIVAPPTLTPAQIAAQQAAITAGQLVPGTTVTQGQLNAAGGGIANIIKSLRGGNDTPVSVATTPAGSTPSWTYTPPVDDPIVPPLADPLLNDPDYTNPVNPWSLPASDITLDQPDYSFEGDDDGFNGVPVMNVIREFARSPMVTSRSINAGVGCPGPNQLIGMLTNF